VPESLTERESHKGTLSLYLLETSKIIENMFKHYGVQLVPTLSGASIVQVRVKYNHHMAALVEARAKAFKLDACRCFNVLNQKGIEMTEVMLEFDSSDENWLRYSALRTEISILQKELDIERLRNLRASIEQDIEDRFGYAICN